MSELTNDTRTALRDAADLLGRPDHHPAEEAPMASRLGELADRWGAASGDHHGTNAGIQDAADRLFSIAVETGALPPYCTARVKAPDPETGTGWEIEPRDGADFPRRSFLTGITFPDDAADLVTTLHAMASTLRAAHTGHGRY